MHAYMRACMHACMHTYIHTYMHTYIYIHQDEFLVMASDGLFDVMEDQSVIDTVGNHLKLTHSYQGAADKLTALAIEKGSLDNVTVVIIELLWGADAIKD